MSVLENHHIAGAFAAMNSQGWSSKRDQNMADQHASKSCDILENLNQEDYLRVRRLMINCVLATDMSKHFSEMAKFKARIGAADFEPKG